MDNRESQQCSRATAETRVHVVNIRTCSLSRTSDNRPIIYSIFVCFL